MRQSQHKLLGSVRSLPVAPYGLCEAGGQMRYLIVYSGPKLYESLNKQHRGMVPTARRNGSTKECSPPEEMGGEEGRCIRRPLLGIFGQ